MRKLFAKAQDPISCETHALGAVAALGGGQLYPHRPYRRGRRPCASGCLGRPCMPPAPSITTIPALPPAAE